jgi:hypothetical protein
MKKSLKQLFLAAPIALFVVLALNSFKYLDDSNQIANGGGIANGTTHFSFNAVDKGGSVVGHVLYAGEYYNVVCVEWSTNSAIIYADGPSKQAFLVTDNGEGSKSEAADTISQPEDWTECGDLDPTDFTLENVTSGNIQVH